MKRVIWLTDIHLNFLSTKRVVEFFRSVSLHHPDAILVGGDTAEAPTVGSYLEIMAREIQRPIYFVLGNHDFYRGSIAAIRSMVERMCERNSLLFWLPKTGLVELTGHTGLIGHDGYADGRLGNYWQSDVILTDYLCIKEFVGLDAAARMKIMQQLGDQAAEHIKHFLPVAFSKYRDVLLLTHVPPFKEACWYQGRPSDDNWLPHFSCKAVGEIIVGFMKERPECQLTVLCGHSHGQGRVQVLPNVRVITGDAQYGKPKVNGILALDQHHGQGQEDENVRNGTSNLLFLRPHGRVRP